MTSFAAARGLDSLAAAMRSVVANRHAIVRDLSTKPGPDLRALDDPLASLHIEIQAMHRRLERTPKGAP